MNTVSWQLSKRCLLHAVGEVPASQRLKSPPQSKKPIWF